MQQGSLQKRLRRCSRPKLLCPSNATKSNFCCVGQVKCVKAQVASGTRGLRPLVVSPEAESGKPLWHCRIPEKAGSLWRQRTRTESRGQVGRCCLQEKASTVVRQLGRRFIAIRNLWQAEGRHCIPYGQAPYSQRHYRCLESARFSLFYHVSASNATKNSSRQEIPPGGFEQKHQSSLSRTFS